MDYDSYAEWCREQKQSPGLAPMNITPPGYPLGYVREKHDLLCGGCGHRVQYSRLLVCVRRGGEGRQMRPAGASETVYDLEINEVIVRGGTPRCDNCLDKLPREPVPRMPAYTERLKPRWGAPQPAKAAVSLDDLDL